MFKANQLRHLISESIFQQVIYLAIQKDQQHSGAVSLSEKFLAVNVARMIMLNAFVLL